MVKNKVGRPPGTHCKNGHVYEGNVTVVARGRYAGERRCKLCIAMSKKKRVEKERALAKLKKESWFF